MSLHGPCSGSHLWRSLGVEKYCFLHSQCGSPRAREETSSSFIRWGTALLTSYLSPGDNAFLQPPVEVNRIVERVLVVHSCKRDCSFPGHLNCRCDPNCYVRSVCTDHREEQCVSCPPRNNISEDHHNPIRNLYEVLSPRKMECTSTGAAAITMFEKQVRLSFN